MKKFIIILILLFFTEANAGLKSHFLDPLAKFFTHPKTVAVIDYLSAYAYSYYNAKADAGVWQKISNINNGETYDRRASIDHFHFNKNAANLALIFKGYAVGMQIKECSENTMSWGKFFARQALQLPMDNFIWHASYNYSRYGKAYTAEPEHNSSRYVIPFPNREIKIALAGRQVKIANAAEFGLGIIPLLSFDFPLSFLEK